MATQREILNDMLANLARAEPDLDTGIGSIVRKMLDTVAEAIAERDANDVLQGYAYDIDAKSGADLDEILRAEPGLFHFLVGHAGTVGASRVAQGEVLAIGDDFAVMTRDADVVHRDGVIAAAADRKRTLVDAEVLAFDIRRHSDQHSHGDSLLLNRHHLVTWRRGCQRCRPAIR